MELTDEERYLLLAILADYERLNGNQQHGKEYQDLKWKLHYRYAPGIEAPERNNEPSKHN